MVGSKALTDPKGMTDLNRANADACAGPARPQMGDLIAPSKANLPTTTAAEDPMAPNKPNVHAQRVETRGKRPRQTNPISLFLGLKMRVKPRNKANFLVAK